MEVTQVERGCKKRENCIVDSIGIGILFCDPQRDASKICSRCNYGDTDNSDAGSPVSAKCDTPPDPMCGRCDTFRKNDGYSSCSTNTCGSYIPGKWTVTSI